MLFVKYLRLIPVQPSAVTKQWKILFVITRESNPTCHIDVERIVSRCYHHRKHRVTLLFSSIMNRSFHDGSLCNKIILLFSRVLSDKTCDDSTEIVPKGE